MDFVSSKKPRDSRASWARRSAAASCARAASVRARAASRGLATATTAKKNEALAAIGQRLDAAGVDYQYQVDRVAGADRYETALLLAAVILAPIFWLFVMSISPAADLVACEDTRHSQRLLDAFGITTRLVALHEHNEQAAAGQVIRMLEEGRHVALITDAGTPAVSDPGARAVARIQEAGFPVVPVPGACALIAALSAAGLPSDRFCYEGFLPAKSKGRRDAMKAIEAEPRTLIFYESTHRLLDSLEDMVAVWGESRYVVLARELTKTWETIHGAPVGELLAWVKEDENRRKGEMVLIVEGHKAQEDDLPADALRTLALLQAELPLKKAAALAAEIHGVKKNALYKYGLEHH